MGNTIFGLGLIVMGLIGGLGVGFGWLAPIVQNDRVTQAIGSLIAAVICILAAAAMIIGGILKLAGVW